MIDELRELYEEMILEHNRNPRNFEKRPHGANRTAYGFNPLCGDEFHVHLTVEEGVVEDVGFEGTGCAVSTASASIMTEALIGKSEVEVKALFEQVRDMFRGESEVVDLDDDIGKVVVLAGVREYPMRVKCATLAWHTMRAALEGDEQTVCTE